MSRGTPESPGKNEMSLDRDDEQRLKSYLLGELAQEEMRELEERLLREEEFANQVLLIEDELIEDYVLGELSSKEQQQFQKYFSNCCCSLLLSSPSV